MRRFIAGFAVAGALAIVPVAAGDRVYHAEHIAFTPVAAAEHGTGFIENIHANGPIVYAHEQYVLMSALPETTYDVNIHVSAPADTTCTSPIITGVTATLTTNPAGNAAAYHVFTPTDIGVLRGLIVHVYWTFTTSGTPAYATTCQTVQLD